MRKKIFSAVIAGLSALGAVLWWTRRPHDTMLSKTETRREEVPASATSLSAQPHKRTRLVPPTPTTKMEVPPPDSSEEGRTPYYFIPGEALVTFTSRSPLTPGFLKRAAYRLEGEYAPVGDEVVAYPEPEGDGWLTVARICWAGDETFEKSLDRFAWLEEQVNTVLTWDDGTRITTWMPNWLGTVAAERLYVPGGPGAYPRPVPPPPGERLSLIEDSFLDEWRASANGPVTLAILDAFPEVEGVQVGTFGEPLKGLMRSLRAGRQPLSFDTAQYYATFRTGKPFNMSNHGFMTAWLASQVIGGEAMKQVTLEPIRVISDDGVCTAADVVAGLARLVRRARDGEVLVVLLAFVMGMGDIIPPRLRHYEEHYEALRLTCLALNEAGATLIAPAGNDATGLQHPPRTRRPASFRSVIEVTAGQLEQGDLALYANQAKALCLFGGEANLQSETAENIPALVGPSVVSELVHMDGDGSEGSTGWIAWAGTSFAAALAAGLAVLLRSAHPDYKMWDVRTKLRSVATEARNPGNVPFVDIVKKPDSPS